MKAVVAEEGRVTIPEALRESMGIVPNTVLDFREENGRLIIEKVIEDDPVADVVGCLKLNRRTDDVMAELRGDA